MGRLLNWFSDNESDTARIVGILFELLLGYLPTLAPAFFCPRVAVEPISSTGTHPTRSPDMSIRADKRNRSRIDPQTPPNRNEGGNAYRVFLSSPIAQRPGMNVAKLSKTAPILLKPRIGLL